MGGLLEDTTLLRYAQPPAGEMHGAALERGERGLLQVERAVL